MRVLIILGHPKAGSFNHAIAGQARSVLEKNGHAVRYHDLYAERFDPVVPGTEIPADSDLPSAILAHCREIAEADGIIIVHPNWWGQPPAILKGWVDRVLRAGVAYRFLEDDAGDGVPMGLLKAQCALVFNTTNTEQQREMAAFGDPLESLWKNCILGYCGVKAVTRRSYGIVVTSTPEDRASWIADVEELVNRSFPAE
jgi:putative NADPH-quinone reductase